MSTKNIWRNNGTKILKFDENYYLKNPKSSPRLKKEIHNKT